MNPIVHVLLLLLAVTWFSAVSRHLLSASEVCPAGCRCSGNNEDAVCCLPTVKQAFPPADPETIVTDKFCQTDDIPVEYRWPRTGSCLPSWRQLQIRLNSFSWPPSPPPPPLPSAGSSLSSTTTCSQFLQRVVIYGTSSTNTGLTTLDASIMRSLLFNDSESLNLTNFTVQKTQITDIRAGFFFTLKASQLTDVKISHNPYLESSGLGIGWLGNTPRLLRLDLSRNALASVDLARWGFSLTESSALTTLILADNRIAHLRAETFIRVPNLVKLDLSGNQLTDLPLDVFQGLNRLKILNLRGNHLSVTGLSIDSMELMTALPSLRQLNLSRNPLLVTVKFAKWWLTGHCPNELVEVDLEDLVSSQPVPSATASSLFLPPIAWGQCRSLVHLALTPNRMLPCLPHHWVGLPPSTPALPAHLHIRPSSLQLCPPVTPSMTATPERPGDGGEPVSDRRPQQSPSLVAVAGNPNGLDRDTISISSNENMHVIKLPTGSLAMWVGILLLALFCLLLLGVGVCLCVFRLCPARQKNKPQLYPPGKQNEYHPFIAATPAGSYAPSGAYYLSAPCPSTDHPTVYTAYPADSLRSYPCTPKHRANSRHLSPTDSGLDDNTPMTVQYSFEPGRSPASSTRTSLVGVGDSRYRHRLSPDHVCARLPGSNMRTSFTSLRPPPVYPRHSHVLFDHQHQHPSQLQLVGRPISSTGGVLTMPPVSGSMVPVTQVLLSSCYAAGCPEHRHGCGGVSTPTATDYASLGPNSTTNCCDSSATNNNNSNNNNEFATTNSSCELNDPAVSPSAEAGGDQCHGQSCGFS